MKFLLALLVMAGPLELLMSAIFRPRSLHDLKITSRANHVSNAGNGLLG
jgi:hypothetical protein